MPQIDHYPNNNYKTSTVTIPTIVTLIVMAFRPVQESAESRQRRGRKRSVASSEAALELPPIADQTTEIATKHYDGIIVECESLEVLIHTTVS